MKRILLLLLALLLLPLCAFAQEDSLDLLADASAPQPCSIFPRPGVYFGMYKEEVEAAEANNGEEKQTKGRYFVSLYTYDDVRLQYYFDYDWVTGPTGVTQPGSLREAVFYFPATEASYYIVEQQLIQDFGLAHYGSDTEETYHRVVKDPCKGNPYMPTSNHQYMNPFSQRLFLQPNGMYILVDHFINNDPNPELNSHKLIFFRLTPEEAAIVTQGRNYTILTDERMVP